MKVDCLNYLSIAYFIFDNADRRFCLFWNKICLPLTSFTEKANYYYMLFLQFNKIIQENLLQIFYILDTLEDS